MRNLIVSNKEEVLLTFGFNSKPTEEELVLREKIIKEINKTKINTKDKEIEEIFNEFCVLVNFDTKLIKIAKKGLEDIEKYKFEQSPSIIKQAVEDTKHLHCMFSSLYSLLEHISLKSHTLRVFKISIRDENINIISPITLLACLFHDFGKSNLLREKKLGLEIGKKYKEHSTVSKIYIEEELKPILEEKDFKLIDELSFLVENHHPSDNRTKNNTNINFIIEMDKQARQEELDLIKCKLSTFKI